MRAVKHPLLKVVTLFIFLIFVGTFLMGSPKTKNVPQDNLLNNISPPDQTISQESKVHSPDGTMKLIMQTETKKDQPKNYLFFTAEISGKNKQLLFTKSVSLGEEMLTPLNSWSPDNKYLFLEEKKPDSVDILVFKASGESFSNDQPYLDVGQLLAKSKAEYRINHVTGWVSPTLIQVNTVKDDLTKGPSYWFDVESRSFLLH